MGAFGSRDSYLGDAADPATLNRYAYAEGNPTASCDPTGHESRSTRGKTAKQVRRNSYNRNRVLSGNKGTWMQRSYTSKSLKTKTSGLLTTNKSMDKRLASGGKPRTTSKSNTVINKGGPSVIERAWSVYQITRSVGSTTKKIFSPSKTKKSSAQIYAEREAARVERLMCSTLPYYNAPKQKNHNSDIHTTLDVIGMAGGAPQLELVGAGADGLNALLYAIKGDFGNASISIMALIPVAGTGASLVRTANKTASAASDVLAGAVRVESVTIRNPVVDNVRSGSALWKSENMSDAQHHFSDIFDNHALDGSEFVLIGDDGHTRTLYQVEGSLNGVDGVFEWIVDPDPAKGVTHRRFIPGQGITGIPNADWKK